MSTSDGKRVIELRRDEPFDVTAAYDDHAESLFAFAVNALRDRAQAEECVQEVFLRAWLARDRFQSGRASVRTWLFVIARRVAIDMYRSAGRRPRLTSLAAAMNHSEPRDHVDDRLTEMIVYEALTRLSQAQREVIVEVQMAGVTYAELATRTGIPVATLRTRMYHGLRALRAALSDMGEGHERAP